jgi:hypothetical protein
MHLVGSLVRTQEVDGLIFVFAEAYPYGLEAFNALQIKVRLSLVVEGIRCSEG